MNRQPAIENIPAAQELAGVDPGQLFVLAYTHYRHDIYEGICNMLKDKTAAEDIVHDVFTKLWTQKESITGIKELQAWLWIAARNQCINVLRKQKSGKKALEELLHLQTTQVITTDSIVQKETQRLVHRAIQSLSPQRKKVFVLGWLEGWNRKQIAEHLQISPCTVKASMQMARRDIRLYMTRHTGRERKTILKKFKQTWQQQHLVNVA